MTLDGFCKVKYSKFAEKFSKKNKAIRTKFSRYLKRWLIARRMVWSYGVKKFHPKNFDNI
ncbi:MAG: hypothetical protein D8G53_00940 [Candidatus Saccharimonas sp.]|nr:MAG: hypothetical protein D8G53_00940 [Candidatus Saccharimonas sp.]